jgi:nitrite reductase/ring-hydroxylating ferredoxin subunit
MTVRGIHRYVQDLLRHRRPKPFPATEEDAAVLRTAIELSAARAGADLPTEAFVSALHARLGAELADEPPPGRGRILAGGGSRRRFLFGASVVAASAAGAAVAVEISQPDRGGPVGPGGTVAQPQETLRPSAGRWYPVAASAELAEGGVRAFQVGPASGFVRRTGGQLVGVSGTCTHQGCRLALDRPAARLECPCHHTAFALGGQVLYHELPRKPAPLPLLEVREQDGEIQVYL